MPSIVDILASGPLLTWAGSVNWTAGFLATVAIFGVLALALNLQWGYTGVFNFGIVAFFMAGAYTSALLTVDPPGDFEDFIGGYELPVLVGWAGAAVAGGLLALLVGLPTLRLRRDFLAIATIGIAAIMRSVANSTEGFVNRARGINGIPRVFPDLVEGADYKWVLLAVTLTVLLLTYLVVRAAASSPWGRVLRAIRDNEATAAAAGKDTVNFRMQSFVLGGMLMGLAGAVWAHRQGTISPDGFDDLLGTFLVWTMLMVGGSGNHVGAVLGALVVGFFWFGTPLLQGQLPEAVSSNVFALRQLAIGFMIVAVLLIRPQGIVPERPRVSRFAPRGPRDVSSPATEAGD